MSTAALETTRRPLRLRGTQIGDLRRGPRSGASRSPSGGRLLPGLLDGENLTIELVLALMAVPVAGP